MVAPRILWRYILRDSALHSLLGLGVFTVLLIAGNLLRFLEDLLAADVSGAALLQLAAIFLPSYLAYAIPTALLFGVLLTFGRMSADGEVVAIRAAGVSVPRLLPPVLALGALCALVTGYLQFELEPASRTRMKSFVRELERATNLIEPGRFNRVGARTLYVESLGDETCPYRGVLIGDLSEAPRPVYIAARCAALDPEASSGLALELRAGSIHLSDEREERYRRIQFQKMRIALRPGDWLSRAPRPRDVRFAELLELRGKLRRGESVELRGDQPELAIEAQLHRRVAFPLASLVLSVLAVPLGIRPLRSGRSAGAITAIAAMGLYWCLFLTAEIAAESGLAPAWLALWVPNAAVLVLACALLRSAIRGDT